jgi:hypothetical protein
MIDLSLTWYGPYDFTSKRQRSLFTALLRRNQASTYGQWRHLPAFWSTTWARRTPVLRVITNEHFCEYTSGAYTIHRAESFAAGRRDPLYKGFAYSKERWRRVMSFINGFGGLAAELVSRLDLLRLFVAPLRSTQRIRRRIEGALIHALYSGDAEVSAFQEEKMRAWTRHPHEEPIRISSKSAVVLRGVPHAFEA